MGKGDVAVNLLASACLVGETAETRDTCRYAPRHKISGHADGERHREHNPQKRAVGLEKGLQRMGVGRGAPDHNAAGPHGGGVEIIGVVTL